MEAKIRRDRSVTQFSEDKDRKCMRSLEKIFLASASEANVLCHRRMQRRLKDGGGRVGVPIP